MLLKPKTIVALLIAISLGGIRESFAVEVSTQKAEFAVEPIDSAHLWKASLSIGSRRAWQVDAAMLDIAPSLENGQVYVPYDLHDAWRELDHMLPTNFQHAIAAQASQNTCIRSGDGKIILLHNALAEFLYDNWIDVQSSRFLASAEGTLGLPPSDPQSRDGYESELHESIAAWTLCNYYDFKKTGQTPNLSISVGRFQAQISNLKRKWKRQVVE